MATVAPATMTTEEMLALPDDGMDRELIRGEVRIRGGLRDLPMTMRDCRHSRVETRVAKFLDNWLDDQPEPRGQVVSGEAGFRLRGNPDTTVGIDVAYVSAETVASTPASSAFFEGPPVLAVEILSPSDTQEVVDNKVALYLEMGVLLFWLINPRFRTITVYRRSVEPECFNALQELSSEPHLSGLRIPVASLFQS